MATVFIEKRNGKRGIKYVVRYKDPQTLKSKYFKTCPKKRDAQAEAAKLRSLLDDGKVPKSSQKKQLTALTFEQVARALDDMWLEKLAVKDISKVTYDGYKLRLDLLTNTFGRRLISDITRTEIKQLRLAQYHAKSAATSNRNLFIIKQVFKHAMTLNAVPIDVSEGIRYLGEQEHERTNFLAPGGIESLIAASQQTRAKFYMPALIYLGAEHGASKQEALSLIWNDIDFDYQGTGLITFYRTKNTNRRTEYLMPRTREALLDWKAHLKWMRKRKKVKVVRQSEIFCRLNGTPIQRFDKAWNNTCRIAGLDDFHYHDLRHTFCSNLILSGSDLKEVKEMIGHKNLSTTDRYSHLTGSHKLQSQKRLAEHYAQ